MLLVTTKRQPSGLHFTTNHTGKMQGIFSLSTSCKHNAQCMKNAQIAGSICSHCFAVAQMKRYGANFERPFVANLEILTSRILSPEEIPYTNCELFRFEAFGDLANITQAVNYIHIAKLNPQTKFALWTKNPRILRDAIKIAGKPDNLSLVLSSLFINKPASAKGYESIFDKIFTVYDKTGQKEVNINCGARDCFKCRKCYTRTENLEYIAEALK